VFVLAGWRAGNQTRCVLLTCKRKRREGAAHAHVTMRLPAAGIFSQITLETHDEEDIKKFARLAVPQITDGVEVTVLHDRSRHTHARVVGTIYLPHTKTHSILLALQF
jgi:hypothetical protein